MVEIGPGLAALTQPLVERLGKLTVIELDRDLAARLRGHGAAGGDRVRRAQGGFRGAGGARWVSPGLRVVGNLPYNISTPILFHLLDAVDAIEDQHFMLQKEVVDRMVARPATSDYGRLSVMLQWRYEMENVLFVPPAVVRSRRRAWTAPWCAWCRCAGAGRGRREAAVASSCRSPSASAASCCATRWANGWSEKSFTGTFDVQRRAEEVPVAEYVALALDEKRGRRACSDLPRWTTLELSRCQPVPRVEGAAHAQRQRGDVHQLVGGHLLAGSRWSVRRPRGLRSPGASFARSAWLFCAERATEKNRST